MASTQSREVIRVLVFLTLEVLDGNPATVHADRARTGVLYRKPAASSRGARRHFLLVRQNPPRHQPRSSHTLLIPRVYRGAHWSVWHRPPPPHFQVDLLQTSSTSEKTAAFSSPPAFIGSEISPRVQLLELKLLLLSFCSTLSELW